MKQPLPTEVRTNTHYWNVCEGMSHGSEGEDTVRVYVLAAQEHGRWEMTQEELDAFDSNGKFWWNGTVDAGFFTSVDDVFSPTEKCFGRLISTGLIEMEKSNA